MGFLRRGRMSVLIALTVGLAAAGIAYASIPGPDGVIHGCYLKSGGNVRVIDSTAKCKATETSLDWNQRGVTGPRGATGARGTTGPTGPAGITLFANVNGIDGSLVGGNATGASRFGAGVYEVTFDRDITNCAGTASPGFNQGSSGVITGAKIEQVNMGEKAKAGPDPNTVAVWISQDSSGTSFYSDSSFHLIVVC